jgi:hypothetical protein
LNAIEELPENATDVSHLINYVILPNMDNDMDFAILEGVPYRDDILEGCDTTSFASRPPNAPREIELIQAWANNPNVEADQLDGESIDVMSWPIVGSSRINKYNTKGLFDMADLPTIVDELREHLQNFPTSRLADTLMRFGIVLRGTHAYWIKCHA